MRYPDEPDHRSGARDVDRSLHRLACVHALKGGVDAHAVGHLLDRRDGLLASRGDDVGGTALFGERLAVGVA
jgi:hypothetical protein